MRCVGAPADIIAVKGDPSHNLKILEYPDLVMSDGKNHR
jgi:imidazolonepropionase-like amidohydrolase